MPAPRRISDRWALVRGSGICTVRERGQDRCAGDCADTFTRHIVKKRHRRPSAVDAVASACPNAFGPGSGTPASVRRGSQYRSICCDRQAATVGNPS